MKKLVLALDVTDAERAANLARGVSDLIDSIKVNYPLVLSAGIRILEKLAEIRPVIADFKIADIPYTSSLIARIAFEKGASAVIIHGFTGSDTVKAVVEIAEGYEGKIYVVTELSSPGGEEFMAPVSLKIVEMARKLGCHGLIAPSTRIDRLAEIRKAAGDMEILCPGIGAQGGSVEALKYADGIIVGRGIYAAEDPRKEAERYRDLIENV